MICNKCGKSNNGASICNSCYRGFIPRQRNLEDVDIETINDLSSDYVSLRITDKRTGHIERVTIFKIKRGWQSRLKRLQNALILNCIIIRRLKNEEERIKFMEETRTDLNGQSISDISK